MGRLFTKEQKVRRREAVARYRAADIERSRKQARESYHRRAAANPEKIKAQQRKVHLRKYGITTAEYDILVAIQNGCCAICKTDNPGRHGRWHIDHCSKTGAVRGLLCHFCNIGLGHFKEDLQALQTAINYLKIHQN